MAASPTTGTVNTVLTNLSSGNDNTPYNKGRQSEQIVSKVHGDFYNQTVGGQMFSVTNGTGTALPLYTTTAMGASNIGGVPIWNTSTNRNVVLVSTQIARISGTTGFGSIILMGRSGVGVTAGTGSPIAAFLTTTPRNNYLGSGAASAVSVYGGTSAASFTLTTAGATTDFLQTLFSMNLEADTGTAHPAVPCTHYYNGSVIVPPGAVVWLASFVASVALFQVTHNWYEAPIPQ